MAFTCNSVIDDKVYVAQEIYKIIWTPNMPDIQNRLVRYYEYKKVWLLNNETNLKKSVVL